MIYKLDTVSPHLLVTGCEVKMNSNEKCKYNNYCGISATECPHCFLSFTPLYFSRHSSGIYRYKCPIGKTQGDCPVEAQRGCIYIRLRDFAIDHFLFRLRRHNDNSNFQRLCFTTRLDWPVNCDSGDSSLIEISDREKHAKSSSLSPARFRVDLPLEICYVMASLCFAILHRRLLSIYLTLIYRGKFEMSR